MNFRSLTILGSTGSIGTQTLDVVRRFRDHFSVVALSAAGRNAELLAFQVEEFRPEVLHVGEEERLETLMPLLPSDWKGKILTGAAGLVETASHAPADLVVVATVGWTGLEPALGAIEQGRHIALANKEVLVCGGHLVEQAAARKGVLLLPIDSEHNAILQCLHASQGGEVRRLILTCSGGPYRTATQDLIDGAGPDQTLRHPTWDMGAKITVDSATLMNKGFEVIEAAHLFHMPYDRIDVVIHPQSTIHSMVEFVDGSILAQLGHTDMRLPIQNVLTWPERRPAEVPPLNFGELAQLTFEEPDLRRFPCLAMAYEAGRRSGSMPCVLNAANEVAVAAHLRGEISCGAIPRILRQVLDAHEVEENPDLERLRHWDCSARRQAENAIAAFPIS